MASLFSSFFSFGREIPRERVTLGVPTITTGHSLIHAGKGFEISGTMAAGTTSAAIGLFIPVAAKATATIVMDDTDANLTYTFKTETADGNAWSVEHVDPADTEQPLVVTVSARKVTVSLATDEGGDIISLSGDVVAAVNSHPEASQFLTCAEAGDGGAVNAVGETSLTGGADKVYGHLQNVVINAAANVVTAQLHRDRDFTGDAINPAPFAACLSDIRPKTPAMQIKGSLNATLAAAGTAHQVKWTRVARGSAQGAGRFAISESGPEENVLRPGLNYTLFLARAGSTAIDYSIFFYEEDEA